MAKKSKNHPSFTHIADIEEENLKQVYLEELNIINAKGLEDIQVRLNRKGVTCITGSNGIGKSTILHLLANAYNQCQDWGKIEPFLHNYCPNKDYKFSSFFHSTRTNYWEGMQCEYKFSNNSSFKLHRQREKNRWLEYSRKRFSKAVFYTGLDYFATEIEVDRWQYLHDHSESKPPSKFTDDMKENVLKSAKLIIGKEYLNLIFLEKVKGTVKNFIGVEDMNIVNRYTSYEMGAGERKVFYLLIWLNMLPSNSLVLIDEPEALLYSTATKELFDFFVEISEKKCLQIVCTTHWENVTSMENVNLFTLYREKNKKISIKSGMDAVTLETMLLEGINRKLLMVEDSVAQLIIGKILQEEEKELFYSTKSFGSVDRFPVIISSLIKYNDKNFWAISDGDVEIKWQSGIDPSHDIDESKLIDKHVSFLPNSICGKGDKESPEDILLKYGKNGLSDSMQKYIVSIQRTAKEKINAIVKHFNKNKDVLINNLIEAFVADYPEEWEAYTKDVKAKIKSDNF